MPGLRDFIPPVCVDYIHRLRGLGFTRLYPSYEEAAAACAAGGFQSEELVHVVERKTTQLREALRGQSPLRAPFEYTRELLTLGLCLRGRAAGGPPCVLDFGGACGAHYFLARAFFADVAFRWCVVETPPMADRGRKVFQCEELSFFDSLEAARASVPPIDLLFSSSCLQYLPDPCGWLRRLADCGAAHVYLTRLGLALGDSDVISTQKSMLSNNGPGRLPPGIPDRKIEYPVVFARKSAFEDVLREKYDVLLEFEEEGRYRVRGLSIPCVGYFARRRG